MVIKTWTSRRWEAGPKGGATETRPVFKFTAQSSSFVHRAQYSTQTKLG